MKHDADGRRQHCPIRMDLLESRLFLTAVTRVDYDPRMPLCKWVYATQDDGVAGTDTVTMLAGSVKIGGVATWEERTESSNGDRNRTFISLSAAEGTRDHKEISVDADGSSSITFEPHVILFPATMQLGRQYDDKSAARMSIGMSGTLAVSYTAIRFEKVTVPAGTFSAARISDKATMDMSMSGWRIVGVVTATSWNVKGIGMVRQSTETLTKTYKNGRLVDTTRGSDTSRLKSYSIPKTTRVVAKEAAALPAVRTTEAGELILGVSQRRRTLW